MKSWILFILLFASLPGRSQTKADKLCVVISGSNKDPNGFLDEKLFTEGGAVAGQKCEVFDGWEKAKTYIRGNLKLKGQLLLIQGAHGNSDGSFDTNEGHASADTVLNDLKTLSQNYHVGSVIHSCYSGAVMAKKMLDDETNPNLDKLCLVTSSSFGRITYSHPDDMIQNLLRSKPGDTLEKTFMNTPAGTISSAAWSEIGLPDYLKNKTVESGYQTLQNLDKIVRGNNTCSSLGEANAALCAAPGITDEMYENLMSFMDPYVPVSYRGFFITNMSNKIRKLKKAQDKVSQAGGRCLEGVLRTYQELYGEKLERLVYWPHIMMANDEVESQAYFSDCLHYQSSLTDDYEKDSLLYSSFYYGVEGYKKSIDKLQKVYTKRKFDESFNLYEFAQAAVGEKRECKPQSKEKILQSLFGDSFFMAEFATNFEGDFNAPDEGTRGLSVSTQLLLKGFQNASLLKKEMPHSSDAKRRAACRNFKF
jgi:hypothetical protein